MLPNTLQILQKVYWGDLIKNLYMYTGIGKGGMERDKTQSKAGEDSACTIESLQTCLSDELWFKETVFSGFTMLPGPPHSQTGKGDRYSLCGWS